MNNEFLQYFHMLIQFERNYHNFGFVSPKGNTSGIKRDVNLNISLGFFLFNIS